MSEENSPSFAVVLTDAHKDKLEKMLQELRKTAQETGHGKTGTRSHPSWSGSPAAWPT